MWMGSSVDGFVRGWTRVDVFFVDEFLCGMFTRVGCLHVWDVFHVEKLHVKPFLSKFICKLFKFRKLITKLNMGIKKA
jgi:hypothetical protein